LPFRLGTEIPNYFLKKTHTILSKNKNRTEGFDEQKKGKNKLGRLVRG